MYGEGASRTYGAKKDSREMKELLRRKLDSKSITTSYSNFGFDAEERILTLRMETCYHFELL